MKIEVTRSELCLLMLACTAVRLSVEAEGEEATKWRLLHDSLEEQLEKYDEFVERMKTGKAK